MSEERKTGEQAIDEQVGFGPKTWGRWSAFLVLPFGFFWAAALMTEGPSLLRFLPVVGLIPLGLGAARTLNKQSGGLRLLSGAWGLAAGLTLAPIFESFTASTAAAPLFWLLGLMAIGGLLLTVLHKEK